MITEKMQKILDENGYFEAKEIEGHGICALERFMFTIAISCGLDETGRQYRYCYPNLLEAVIAFDEWDGKGHPPGPWIKRKGLRGDLRNPETMAEWES